MTNRKSLGRTLRKWRGNDSLEAVAAACRVTVQTIKNWENGVSEPKATQLHRLECYRSGLLRALGLAAA